MTECPNQLQIEAYYDGELSPEAAREIDAHLADCDSCRRELQHLRAMTQFVQSFNPAPITRDVMARLHEQVDALTQRDTLRFAKQLSSLAACLLVAAGVWFATTSQTSEASPAPWERAAVTLQLDTNSQTSSATSDDTAQWMLTELSGSRADGQGD
jgi:anti-sigma factor RsiW